MRHRSIKIVFFAKFIQDVTLNKTTYSVEGGGGETILIYHDTDIGKKIAAMWDYAKLCFIIQSSLHLVHITVI